TGLQYQLLNGAVLLAVFIPSAALGLAIRRARQRKAVRESDSNAAPPLWLTLKAAGFELADFRTRLAALALDVGIVVVAFWTLRAAMGAGIAHSVVDGIFLIGYYSIGIGLGATVGARVAGIRVVTCDGSRPGIGRGI